MTLLVDSRPIDVRAVTLPTAYGESVVLRILDKHRNVRNIEELGMSAVTYTRFSTAIHQAWGLVLVTGPTGSGKSSSLYAGLSAINDRQRNILTIEDPIEYLMPGVKQMQVSRRAGLDFATALRSILRADPDVLLVGEIRDIESLNLAAEAALTGHLVLSTLHTNDAASTPMRLLEMGLEPYLVTSALSCIVAQRLVRRLCDRCKQEVHTDPKAIVQLGLPEDIIGPGAALFEAVGCDACDRAGYRGRFAVHEAMTFGDTIRGLVLDRAPVEEIRRVAITQGMETMWVAGARRVAAGETTLDELARVLR